MVKKLINPLQTILMQKKMCPACTRPLSKAKLLESKNIGLDLIECECKRIFIHNKDLDVYRRALMEEL